MKKYTLLPLLLALSLLTGCGSLLERSYTAVTPTPSFPTSQKRRHPPGGDLPGPGQRPAVPGGAGEETGTVRLYQYGSVTGTAASDVDQACLEVTQEDPLGAYAVDYIKYDVKQTPSYYQVEVKLAYAVDPRGAQPGDLRHR